MLFPVVFYEKLGISDDMSTGNMCCPSSTNAGLALPLHIIITHSVKRRQTATAGSDVVQYGRPIFDDFFQHLWPYIGNNTANVAFQMVKRLWLIRIDQ
ncbi:hypothetical protein TNCV_1634461 [Trichonephila clavipes]|nr:hypothetical protein TNCV_1634461 [Trichonephila clavipes]